ncbi:MAG: hypothetical protein H0W50_08240 [Parachlamydiaceae bacterium]|nr:hypothetical protein [Parachlamydiaceae bacterium]
MQKPRPLNNNAIIKNKYLIIITLLTLTFLLPNTPSFAAEKVVKEAKDSEGPKTVKKSERTLAPVSFISDDEIKNSNSDSFIEEEFNDTATTPSKKNMATIEGADITFSFTITINSNQSIKTPIIIQPFVIEPDGHVIEFGKYKDQIEEGLNTRFIRIPTQIDNPLKGNYVVGYLASFQDPVDASLTFSGEVKGALSKPVKNENDGEVRRKINVFVSEQASVKGPSGRDIISVSSDLDIF